MRDILAFFKINPRLVAKAFALPLSGWPNLKPRDGKHVVDPDKLFESWENCPYGGEFVVLVDGSSCLKDIAEWSGKTPVKILAGATFLLHDYVNGSGGLEVTSIRDTVLKPELIHRFVNDKGNRYGIQSVHGMTESVWNSVVEIPEVHS